MTNQATSSVAAEQLMSYIQRIERLESEKKTLQEDIKEVWSEAKGNGFDQKAMKEILKLRAMEEHDAMEFEEVRDVYKRAAGL